jgi:hypothetical protein
MNFRTYHWCPIRCIRQRFGSFFGLLEHGKKFLAQFSIIVRQTSQLGFCLSNSIVSQSDDGTG